MSSAGRGSALVGAGIFLSRIAGLVREMVAGRVIGINGAADALRSGDYDEAVGLYEDVVRAEPSNSRARIDLMEALVAIGRYEDAVEVGRAAPDPAIVGHDDVRNELGSDFSLWPEQRLDDVLSLALRRDLRQSRANTATVLADLVAL